MHSNHFPWPGELAIQTNQSLPLIRGTYNTNKSIPSPGQGNLQYKQINHFPSALAGDTYNTNKSITSPHQGKLQYKQINHFPLPGKLKIQPIQSIPLIRGTCNTNKSITSPDQGNLYYKQIYHFP